jgi:hypothetical protein
LKNAELLEGVNLKAKIIGRQQHSKRIEYAQRQVSDNTSKVMTDRPKGAETMK